MRLETDWKDGADRGIGGREARRPWEGDEAETPELPQEPPIGPQGEDRLAEGGRGLRVFAGEGEEAEQDSQDVSDSERHVPTSTSRTGRRSGGILVAGAAYRWPVGGT